MLSMKSLCLIISVLFPKISSSLIDTMREQRQLWNESDSSHQCVRECVAGFSKVCYYSLVVDWHSSMSVQCGDCPYNSTQCSNPGCIVGGGIVRPVISANRRTPGPSITVCENDTIVMDVTNAMDRELLTVHMHGIHQEHTQFMDGAPFVTQCPITPGSSFRYQFMASPHGTHMWHGHVGYHDASGLFGALVVRRPEPSFINTLYDYDLQEHTVTIWHWYNESDSSVLPPILDTYKNVNGYGILINGQASFGKFQSKVNATEILSTPKAKFYVDQGYRYRFRLIANSAIYCPVQLSIDNHTLLVIASETDYVEPQEVDSLVLSAGERFSVVVAADQVAGCYWVRFRGMGDCDNSKTSTHGEALLCYTGYDYEPVGQPTYEEGRRSGRLLNPVQQYAGEDYSQNSLILFSELSATESDPYNYTGTPDATLYIELTTVLLASADAPGPWHLFNDIVFEFPSSSLLSQRDAPYPLCDDPPSSQYCLGDFCSCTYVKQVPLNGLVEVVMVDTGVGYNQDHPIHLHGYKYQVVAMEVVGANVSLELVKGWNEQGLIPKRLSRAPGKDTVSVPNAGYVVVRFRADNPGFWLFHCHVTNHLIMGMGMILQVGESKEMPDPPPNFPTCGSRLYDAAAEALKAAGSSAAAITSPTTILIGTVITIFTTSATLLSAYEPTMIHQL